MLFLLSLKQYLEILDSERRVLTANFRSVHEVMFGMKKLSLYRSPSLSYRNHYVLLMPTVMQAYYPITVDCKLLFDLIKFSSRFGIHLSQCRNRITQKLVFDLVAQEYRLTKAQVFADSPFCSCFCNIYVCCVL